jgi:hypothetical protein
MEPPVNSGRFTSQSLGEEKKQSRKESPAEATHSATATGHLAPKKPREREGQSNNWSEAHG